MKKNSLSVTIITLNEQESIKRCIDSINEIADEIVVVDSGSRDKTVDIARKNGASTYFRKFDNYANQKNFAQSKASCEWILSLDADEIVTEMLADEIRTTIEIGKADAYLIPRRNIIFNAEIKHTRWSPDKHVWLWRRGKGKWIGKVHEELIVDGKMGELKNAKIHYQYKTIRDFLVMVNKYTNYEAEERFSRGDKPSYLKVFISPAKSFVGRFFYKRGFIDGWRGFVLSYLMAFYRLVVWVKIWEKTRAKKLS